VLAQTKSRRMFEKILFGPTILLLQSLAKNLEHNRLQSRVWMSYEGTEVKFVYLRQHERGNRTFMECDGLKEVQ
jgi:hypothetical protein